MTILYYFVLTYFAIGLATLLVLFCNNYKYLRMQLAEIKMPFNYYLADETKDTNPFHYIYKRAAVIRHLPLRRQLEEIYFVFRFNVYIIWFIRISGRSAFLKWPVFIPSRINSFLQARKSYQIKQQSLLSRVQREHFGERISIEEIEEQARKISTLPDVLFNYNNDNWLTFKREIKPGDEIYTFIEPLDMTEVVTENCSGYALVRNSQIVHFFILRDELVIYPGTPEEFRA